MRETLDVKGLMCPLPVLKARKALQRLPAGATLDIEATDPAAAIDFPHFCTESGHELVAQSRDGDVLCFTIRKAGSRPDKA
ncbi:MAG: sulfurtransferase TusA family protein [Rhodobiaceae bacterium]|nr:sulfurtransferase TusA family protein [Rhodobiaceae bacterium]